MTKPIAAMAMPGYMTIFAPKRSTSLAVMPVDRTPIVNAWGRNASPVLTGLYPRTCSK